MMKNEIDLEIDKIMQEKRDKLSRGVAADSEDEDDLYSARN